MWNCEVWGSLIGIYSFMSTFYISLSYMELLSITLQCSFISTAINEYILTLEGFRTSHSDLIQHVTTLSNGLKEKFSGLLKRMLNGKLSAQ